MGTRKEYLDEIKARLGETEAQSEELMAQATRSDYDDYLTDIRAKQESAKAKLAELERASGESWQALRAQTDVGGSNSMNLLSWDEVGAAAKGIIEAITRLDDAGFHGPYSLALAPERYNLLFRLYPQGRQSELEHLKTMVTAGVLKTPILRGGGVLLASTAQCASIVLGQDLSFGYVGPAGAKQEFTISESLTVHIRQPRAICVLKEA